MLEVNRFIQFNDEAVDTRALLLYERLGQALAENNEIILTERKLMEFNPKEEVFSMSVFWRHRTAHVMHLGRLSDIYLLSLGFWRHFDLTIWKTLTTSLQDHHLQNLALELLILFEEYRLMDKVEKQRPGTVQSFSIRKKTYIDNYKVGIQTSFQKGYVADSLLQECYLSLHDNMLTDSIIDIEGLDMTFVRSVLEKVQDVTSTLDSMNIVTWIIDIVEEVIKEDLTQQYYSVVHSVIVQDDIFSYHDGITNTSSTEVDEQNTIEEQFRTWHETNKSEEGVHLQFELEHGQSSDLSLSDVTEGNEDATVQSVGHGQSEANEKELIDEELKDNERTSSTKKRRAHQQFGKEHTNVTYEELSLQGRRTEEQRQLLQLWREEHYPYVKAFVHEMKKRIEQKQIARRDNLTMGRLSKKLTTFLVDERPRPFYKKTAPSIALDAVFGLLVDGSASMIDKLDETKKAVLLFHDVLRELQVKHQISLYYEDSFHASQMEQPNYFEHMHTFQEGNRDNGETILSFEAHEDNRDGFAIRWMTEKLKYQNEKHKFLLVFSDGEPSAFGYAQNGVLDTAEAVIQAEKQGVTVIHLLLSTTEPSHEQKELFASMFGNRTASSSSVDDFADQTLRILRKIFTFIVQ